MKITFFGHADFLGSDKEEKVVNLLQSVVKDGEVEFLLGGYGGFDSFSRACCQKLKRYSNKIKCTFVTPYLGEYLENRKESLDKLYDSIVYPPIENVFKKFAIIKRNQWMIDESDLIIVYVCRNYGGAYSALQYAKKKNKKIINLYDL